jgi:hypothetical protein
MRGSQSTLGCTSDAALHDACIAPRPPAERGCPASAAEARSSPGRRHACQFQFPERCAPRREQPPGQTDRAMTNVCPTSENASPSAAMLAQVGRFLPALRPADGRADEQPARSGLRHPLLFSKPQSARRCAALPARPLTYWIGSPPPPLRAKEQEQCQTARCLSMPRIPRKLGSWSSVTDV